MTLRGRRSLVIGAVAASLLLGAASIRVAAHLAVLSAAPTAPPVSLDLLRDQLAAERARSAALEQQLADLLDATSTLTAALDATQSQVSVDGLTADQLRRRLVAAQQKLADATAALADAESRLTQQGGATSSGDGGGAGAGGPAGAGVPPAPTLTLTLAYVAGGVQASWSSCPASGFAGAVLVRSTDREIHYPPEDFDTVVARVSSLTTTIATDTTPPLGALTYRLYCLSTHEGETNVSAQSPSASISVP